MRHIVAVHPRACGEHSAAFADLPIPMNSVHPRACGEHCPSWFQWTRMKYGSSPRLRGTPMDQVLARELSCTVHPRACGEHSSACDISIISLKRFIPAPAGNTAIQWWWFHVSECYAVHPRACGEHTRHSPAAPCSRCPVHPRACGEHDRAAFTSFAGGLFRFIPAPAGNTYQRGNAGSNVIGYGSSPRLRGTPS